jgi:hypothetical protein
MCSRKDPSSKPNAIRLPQQGKVHEKDNMKMGIFEEHESDGRNEKDPTGQ